MCEMACVATKTLYNTFHAWEREIMTTLSSGLVIAGAFADKMRRTLFAQVRGRVTGGEIMRASAELNRLLYGILVDGLKVDKGDVVRIRIDYDVEGDRIVWALDTLRIEAFRRMPEVEIAKKIEEMRR